MDWMFRGQDLLRRLSPGRKSHREHLRVHMEMIGPHFAQLNDNNPKSWRE